MLHYDTIEQTLNRLVEEFGMAEFADRIQLPTRVVKQIESGGYENIHYYDMWKVCEACNFSFDNVQEQKIDSEAVVGYLLGESLAPKRYEQNAMSSKVIPRAIIGQSAIELVPFIRNVLKYLQVDPAYLEDDGLISTELTFDISSKIAQNIGVYGRDVSIDMLYALGQVIGYDLRDSEFARSFSKLKNLKTVIEKLSVEIFDHVEKSHRYKLVKLTDKYAIVRRYPINRKVRELSQKNSLSYGPSCAYAIGWLSVVPLYSKNPSVVDVMETKCFYTGAKYCEWIIDFSSSRRHSFHQPFRADLLQ